MILKGSGSKKYFKRWMLPTLLVGTLNLLKGKYFVYVHAFLQINFRPAKQLNPTSRGFNTTESQKGCSHEFVNEVLVLTVV